MIDTPNTNGTLGLRLENCHEDAKLESFLKRLKCINTRLEIETFQFTGTCKLALKMLLELEVCEEMMALIKSDLFKLMYINNKVCFIQNIFFVYIKIAYILNEYFCLKVIKQSMMKVIRLLIMKIHNKVEVFFIIFC